MNTIPALVLALSLLTSLIPFSALAQETTQTGTSQYDAVLVSAAGLTDVSSRESSGTYTGTYSLIGGDGMGQQNNINVGIVVYSDTNALLDVTSLETNLSVRQGEIQHRTFSYTLPSYLSGTVRVFLRADTEEGLSLGMNLLGEKSYAANTKRVLNCSQPTANTALFSCTATQAGRVSLSFSRGGLLSTSSTGETTVSLLANKTTPLQATLTPGRYYAHISFSSNKEQFTFPVSIPGASAQIVNVAVAKLDDHTVQVTVPIQVTHEGMSPSVAVTLSSAEGSACGTGNQTITETAPLGVIKVSTTCHTGNVQVVLTDHGTTLDTLTVPFDIDAVPSAASATHPSPLSLGLPATIGGIPTWWILLIIGLVLISIAVYVVMKRRQGSVWGESNLPGMNESGTPFDRTQNGRTM